MKGSLGRTVIAACAIACAAMAQQVRAEDDTADRIKKGSSVYSQNCSPCHGPRMLDPQGAFDLKSFPRDERERFLTSVTRGKNQMPPWGGLLSREDIESLWLYVIAGEK